MRSRHLVCALLLFACTTIAAAEATLSGRVVSMLDGSPVVNAVVRVEGLETGVGTGPQGHFVFAGVPEGPQALSIYFEGEWYEYVRTVEVSGAEVTDLLIELPLHRPGELREDVVVTAGRVPASVANTPDAVTILDREMLERFTNDDVADVLRGVPGFNLYESQGSAADPALNVRGFTGGGENDYALVLVDGVRVNDLNTGRIDWREIPVEDLERVEVARGPISSLYGDTAIGGVVQLFTREPVPGWRATTTSGSFGEWGLNVARGGRWGERVYRASVDVSKGNGWRDHGEYRDIGARASLSRHVSEVRSWAVALWLKSDEHDSPGPLPRGLFESDPQTTLAPYDEAERQRLALSLRDRRPLGEWVVDSQLSLRTQDDSLVDTIFLGDLAPPDPPLAETSRREFEGSLLWLDLRGSKRFGKRDRYRVTTGVEYAMGDYDSDYFGVDRVSGADTGARASGDGDRTTLAAFGQVEAQATERVRVFGALRYDRIEDSFTERLNQPVGTRESDNDALSPRIGLTFVSSPTTSFFGSFARTFRAPTPFQLFDQREITVLGAPPITNPGLEPLRGIYATAGFRYRLPEGFGAEATLYNHDLEDEIGFDFNTFRTDNIAESRHRGYEVSLFGELGSHWNLQASYAYNDAEVRAGEDRGNQIEMVPRYVTTAGAAWQKDRWSASAFLRAVRESWLDGANTRRLDDYTTVDLTLVRREAIYGLEARLEITNALDEEYASWGFVVLDGSERLYPATERAIRLKVIYRP